MNKVHNTSRLDLLKEVKTSVNTLFFAPSEQRRKEALASLEALVSFVEAIEVPKPKASKPVSKKAKPSKAAPKEQAVQPKAEEMMELFKQFLASQGMAEASKEASEAPSEPKAQPKPKASRRKKSSTSRKPKVSRRPSRNEKLEAQAQRLSLKAAEDRAAKNAPKEVVVCDNKPTKASPFGTRRLATNDEVVSAAKAAAAKRQARQAALAAQAKLLAEQEALAEATAEQLDLFNDDFSF